MSKLIFLFLDGVGIGRAEESNPFFAAGAEYLSFFEPGAEMPDKTPIKAIDARLGVPGIPMSATGQTSLFTGVNAPRMFFKHKDSYPDKLMRKIIKDNNIFSRLKKKGVNVRFLNAYPGRSNIFTPQHIRIRDDGEISCSPFFNSQFRGPLSVTTCMMVSSYMKPFGRREILMEKALFHDFSNKSISRGNGDEFPNFSPEKAAEIIFNVSRSYDLLLYEFFQTDMYGHGFFKDECVALVGKLERLVKRLVSLMDKEKDTLLITSDHGNLEDSKTQLHTFNPVPLVCWGFKSSELRNNIKSLVDVTPTIVNFFNSNS